MLIINQGYRDKRLDNVSEDQCFSYFYFREESYKYR